MAATYVRDSTDPQDVDKQHYGGLASAYPRGLDPLPLVAEAASDQLAWRERALGRVLAAPIRAETLCAAPTSIAWSTRHGRGWR